MTKVASQASKYVKTPRKREGQLVPRNHAVQAVIDDFWPSFGRDILESLRKQVKYLTLLARRVIDDKVRLRNLKATSRKNLLNSLSLRSLTTMFPGLLKPGGSSKLKRGNRRKPATKQRVAPKLDYKWAIILLLLGVIIGLIMRPSAHALPEQPVKHKAFKTASTMSVPKVVEQTPVAPVPTPPVAPPKPVVKPTPVVITGGDLPAVMLRIRACESGNNYTAQNKTSTASGAFQFVDGTWANYGGYAKAKYAPPEVQDAKALLVYNSSGTRPWVSSQHCWG